jgi:hypothetical protein
VRLLQRGKTGTLAVMETSDELAALEFDFRRSLIAELKRVAQREDSEFFAIDQPQYRNGRPTLKKLADEIIALRTKMNPPNTRCPAADFLGYCIKWGLRDLGQSTPSSSVLAAELLEGVQHDNDG